MVESDNPVEPSQKIIIDGEEYQFLESSAKIFNRWDEVNRPLPFVNVYMRDKDGKEVLVHVTDIARTIDSQGEASE